MGDLDRTASQLLVNHRPIDTGRHQGILSLAEIATVAADPALAWLSLEPVMASTTTSQWVTCVLTMSRITSS